MEYESYSGRCDSMRSSGGNIQHLTGEHEIHNDEKSRGRLPPEHRMKRRNSLSERVKENVDNNTYPLARPLFIYSTAEIMKDKPQVAAFINFFLTYVNEEITDVGYFPASDDALNLARFGWLTANN